MTMVRSFSSSARALLLFCVLPVFYTLPAHAHPRDELGQASYVGITASAVTVELNLTPGDLLAPAFAALAEKPDYPQWVLSELMLSLDGVPLPLRLVKCQLPEHESLRRGEQSMRLFFQAPLASLPGGKHMLSYQNLHAPLTVKNGYLATTLMGSEDIRIGQQTHDATQQALTVEFHIPSRGLPLQAGILGAVLVLCGCYGWHRRR
jgi:hypothetical protein